MKAFRSIAILGILLFLFHGCSDEEQMDTHPFIVFKQGGDFTTDGARIPVGGQMKFGISAVGDGSPITNLRIKRITADQVVVEMDRGLFQESGGLDTVFSFVKGPAEEERWNFFIMNGNRDTASADMTILKGSGSGYGPIRYHPSLTIGFQGNQPLDHYLDPNEGITYSSANITGNESKIDIVAYFYYTSGNPSPTLTCPDYTSAITYYPEFLAWPRSE
ncbi:MAG: hypothetical protein PHD61_13170, partial [Bacteroidales bacterium]|nr:hypothetical protein [Bacteroidales bacterium]